MNQRFRIHIKKIDGTLSTQKPIGGRPPMCYLPFAHLICWEGGQGSAYNRPKLAVVIELKCWIESLPPVRHTK